MGLEPAKQELNIIFRGPEVEISKVTKDPIDLENPEN
jgi:hypothetical protein